MDHNRNKTGAIPDLSWIRDLPAVSQNLVEVLFRDLLILHTVPAESSHHISAHHLCSRLWGPKDYRFFYTV